MKQPIRVCMVGSSFTVSGGMTSVCRQIVSHPFDTVEITYVVTHAFAPFPKQCLLFAKGYLHIFRLMLTGKVDVVHLHMSERGSFYRKYLVHRLARRFRLPDVVHMHGAEFREFYDSSGKGTRRRIRRMLRECDRCLVLGDHWEQIIHQMEPEAAVEILSNAVPIPEQTALWDEAETRLCYVGVLIPRKGVGDLLQALRLLLDRPDLPRPVRLTIAGSGEAEQALKDQCRELGLEQQVDFVGWTQGEEKTRLMLGSQCFVLPSYNEGLPVAVLEAIGCGLPVVATNVGAMNEAVQDGVDGRLLEGHDPGALADAIFDVTRNRERWRQMSRQARVLTRERFDEQILFDRLERLYQELTGEAPV